MELEPQRYAPLDSKNLVDKIPQEHVDNKYNPLLPRRFVQSLTNISLNTLSKYDAEGIINGYKYREGHFDVVGYPISEAHKLFEKKGYSFKKKKDAEVICVWSLKGGVGKSSTAQHLSSMMSLVGKVLVIDIDCQADTTRILGGVQNYTDVLDADTPPTPTIAELINWTMKDGQSGKEKFHNWYEELELDQVIKKITPNLHIIPSDLSLSEINYSINRTPIANRIDPVYGDERAGALYLIKEVIDKVRSQYDFIIIDTPPSIEVSVMGCLYAANRILIPAELSAITLTTMTRNESFLKTLSIDEKLVSWDKVLIVPTKEDNDPIKRKARSKLEEHYSDHPYISLSSMVLPTSTIVNKTADLKMPIYSVAFSNSKEFFPFRRSAKVFTDIYWTLMHEILGVRQNHYVYQEDLNNGV